MKISSGIVENRIARHFVQPGGPLRQLGKSLRQLGKSLRQLGKPLRQPGASLRQPGSHKYDDYCLNLCKCIKLKF
jgi:hypothetical protein